MNNEAKQQCQLKSLSLKKCFCTRGSILL